MPLMLAKDYADQDPTNWLMSEKLDGVRAHWTGTTLQTKSGKKINTPEWFTNDLPSTPLDGELWQGRGQFEAIKSLVRSKSGRGWESVRFMIFDNMGSEAAHIRQRDLLSLDLPDHCEVVTQTLCTGITALEAFEASILKGGGEGVMIKCPLAAYEDKRSDKLLKIKRFSDSEAVVTGYKPGTGRNSGRIAALICDFDGHTISLGTGLSSHQRERPPEIGALVTFKYFGLTHTGKPRHAAFVCVRDYE